MIVAVYVYTIKDAFILYTIEDEQNVTRRRTRETNPYSIRYYRLLAAESSSFLSKSYRKGNC